jgi:hypothetical protein
MYSHKATQAWTWKTHVLRSGRPSANLKSSGWLPDIRTFGDLVLLRSVGGALRLRSEGASWDDPAGWRGGGNIRRRNAVDRPEQLGDPLLQGSRQAPDSQRIGRNSPTRTRGGEGPTGRGAPSPRAVMFAAVRTHQELTNRMANPHEYLRGEPTCRFLTVRGFGPPPLVTSTRSTRSVQADLTRNRARNGAGGTMPLPPPRLARHRSPTVVWVPRRATRPKRPRPATA